VNSRATIELPTFVDEVVGCGDRPIGFIADRAEARDTLRRSPHVISPQPLRLGRGL
jgi:hypothetical protein